MARPHKVIGGERWIIQKLSDVLAGGWAVQEACQQTADPGCRARVQGQDTRPPEDMEPAGAQPIVLALPSTNF